MMYIYIVSINETLFSFTDILFTCFMCIASSSELAIMSLESMGSRAISCSYIPCHPAQHKADTEHFSRTFVQWRSCVGTNIL
jgi:hypothetical protein